MKRRLLACLIALALCLTLLPTTVFAADTGKAIQLGAGGISGYDTNKGGNGYDYIYMGSYNSSPVKWRVLDTKTNMENATEGDGLFLLSDVLLGSGTYGDIYFKKDGSSNAWQNSDAQAWCKDFAGIAGNSVTNAFSSLELGAILETTKSDVEKTPFAASTDILNGDKVFFLSAEEAENADYGFTNDAARVANYGTRAFVWWLRSPAINTALAGAVGSDGRVNGFDCFVVHDQPARPAFNLNLNSVLFTSAADNSGHNSSFAAPADYSGSDWKVTLKDSNDFSTGTSVTSGNTTLEEGYAAEALTITHAALSSLSNDYTNVTVSASDKM